MPERTGALNGRIIELNGECTISTFDYRRIYIYICMIK